MARPFSVEVAGSFYTFPLYDGAGREVTNMQDAASVAEDEFGDDWQSVFNGDEAMDRNDWTA